MFIRLTQFHPDGHTTPLLVNYTNIINVQERLNKPAGALEMDPVTKTFPQPKVGSALSFANSHAFVQETVDEVWAMIRSERLRT